MTLQLGDVAPDFEADTTEGRIKFHDWIGDSWAVLFSHPKDFTPVCTTELGYMAKIKPDFDARDVKIIGLSVDPLDNHEEWAKDIEETQGTAPNYPIISDNDFNVSKLYGMLPADTSGDAAGRTPADNQTVRNVFVIAPDKKVKLILVYPMTTGRNFDEVLRVIDSLQLTANHKVATPVNWKPGEKVIIAGSVSNDQAKEIYPDGWEEPRPYIRIVPAAELAGDAAAAGLERRAPAAATPARRRRRSPAGARAGARGCGRSRPRSGGRRRRRRRSRRRCRAVRMLRARAALRAARAAAARARRRPRAARRCQRCPAGITPDERVDHVVGRERRDRRQLAEQRRPTSRVSPISSSASRSAVSARSASSGSWRPPGKEISPAWRRRSARRLVSTTCGGSASRGEEQRDEHGRARLLGRAVRGRRDRLAGAGGEITAGRPGSGGQVNALNALQEHDLAVERAVHGALRGDHAQALDLLLGQVVGQAHDELELRRAAALGRAVLDVDLDVADVPALARRVHLHRDRRTRGEADGEQLLRARARRPRRRRASGSSTVSWWSRTWTVCLKPSAVASRGGFHPCQPVRSTHFAPFQKPREPSFT